MIDSDTFLTEPAWQVLIKGYLTSLLLIQLISIDHDHLKLEHLLTSNAKFAQSGMHQSMTQDVPEF